MANGQRDSIAPYCPADGSHPWNLISINEDKDDMVLDPYFRVQHLKNAHKLRAFLSLAFWDIRPKDLDADMLKQHPDAQKRLFTAEQAQQVREFVDLLQKDPEPIPLVVHCHAGVSRSGAVGIWIVRRLGLDLEDFCSANRYIDPNQHVLKLLEEK